MTSSDLLLNAVLRLEEMNMFLRFSLSPAGKAESTFIDLAARTFMIIWKFCKIPI
jgi:hypothetical protein